MLWCVSLSCTHTRTQLLLFQFTHSFYVCFLLLHCCLCVSCVLLFSDVFKCLFVLFAICFCWVFHFVLFIYTIHLAFTSTVDFLHNFTLPASLLFHLYMRLGELVVVYVFLLVIFTLVTVNTSRKQRKREFYECVASSRVYIL